MEIPVHPITRRRAGKSAAGLWFGKAQSLHRAVVRAGCQSQVLLSWIQPSSLLPIAAPSPLPTLNFLLIAGPSLGLRQQHTEKQDGQQRPGWHDSGQSSEL